MRTLKQKVDVAGWLGGPPNASNASGTPKCVKNATPSSKSASKMRPLVQKLRVWMPYRKLWGAFRGAENRTPEHEIASKMRPLKQKVGVEMAKMATLQQK